MSTKPVLSVIVEGYAREASNNVSVASSSTILLQYKNGNYLIDPGCNPEKLQEALALKSLTTTDITAIFLTHYHLDHVLNIRLFPRIPLYDGAMLWQDDLEIPHHDSWLFPEFQMIYTPGHAFEEYSLLVDTENLGLVSISQDIFWWADGTQNDATVDLLLATEDPFAYDQAKLQESRRKILNSGAQWIIPGHGVIFKNPLQLV
jgi:glyoxylase-like metal-dependent hydrolase (beta-lactamase superfamily II)